MTRSSAPHLALLLPVLAFLTFSHARIPSRGSQTAFEVRNAFNDSAFRLPYAEARLSTFPDYSVQSLEAQQFPVLGAVDIQTRLLRIVMQPGSRLATQLHPRGNEVIHVVRGAAKISFTFESDPSLDTVLRRVTNVVRAREVALIPQGLVHDVECVSKVHPCILLSVANSADPGFVVL
ncbi:Oxalate oxidase GF-2.8 [Gracilariopsis chorda]|uniref:Oxalate oxidase GF-2.8 n=1 Tax=Gracilariopsis chorda TaxID=448386 RepID=A0A2V3IBP7_9FLOR|nr:Oxalate oxidase GF-2.8 [Gracilariopsis chorda]PXF39929.1 Oxalate oxidase GF-2.8 [Gracilariopsis chorda]|eukprot:PXF39501.1 Oxalate oxidase GF-2.8 [Gracilariopsis chorda]